MDVRSANRKIAGKLLVVSVLMFAFGVFAMPPLYDKFCEITGIGQAGIRIDSSKTAATDGVAAHNQRTVKLFFDATANSALPWGFKPVQRSMAVTLGMPVEASYQIDSLVEVTTAGRAVYNVTPPEAAQHFVKTECFCFSRQQLAAGESKVMPVRFFIDKSLPDDINEITLSYTFFLNEESGDSEPQDQQATPGTT